MLHTRMHFVAVAAGIKGVDEKAAQLMDMGFEYEKCVAALEKKGGNTDQALELLLSEA